MRDISTAHGRNKPVNEQTAAPAVLMSDVFRASPSQRPSALDSAFPSSLLFFILLQARANIFLLGANAPASSRKRSAEVAFPLVQNTTPSQEVAIKASNDQQPEPPTKKSRFGDVVNDLAPSQARMFEEIMSLNGVSMREPYKFANRAGKASY